MRRDFCSEEKEQVVKSDAALMDINGHKNENNPPRLPL